MSGFNAQKLSAAGVLITIGIVFGDIGTSPLYVFDAITNGNYNRDLILGGLSAVIWTLILLATVDHSLRQIRRHSTKEELMSQTLKDRDHKQPQ